MSSWDMTSEGTPRHTVSKNFIVVFCSTLQRSLCCLVKFWSAFGFGIAPPPAKACTYNDDETQADAAFMLFSLIRVIPS